MQQICFTKHIDLDVHFIINLIIDHKLGVRYVPTAAQPADIFTKALSLDRFSILPNKLTMTDHMLSFRGPIAVHASDKHFSSKLLLICNTKYMNS